MKKFLSVLGASLFALGFVGCSNEMDNSKDLLLLQSGASKSEYGTIIIKNDTRALSTDELTSATVTVSGYGINDISSKCKNSTVDWPREYFRCRWSGY